MFDLDGTLLCSDKTIAQTTLKSIQEYRKKGILIGVCTSRGEQNAFAMGNAVNKVKECADLVIGSNDKDG